jgi:hypothetical protein
VAESDQDDTVSIPIVFVGGDEMPVLYTNQFVIQLDGQSLILTAGQLTPPILIGSNDEQREQAKQLSYVPVRVVARLAITRDQAAVLSKLLDQQITLYDKRQKEQG